MQAILALEDGRVFSGKGFGAAGTVTGEICFNTAMCGYQELLTDPRSHGQIIAMTYPHIGNYGINSSDNESDRPQAAGFVIDQLSGIASNWRSEETLDDYLKRRNIPGVRDLDVRAVTRHVRKHGSMKACLSVGELDSAAAVEHAKNSKGLIGSDYTQAVTTKQAYLWDPENKQSRKWTLPRGAMDKTTVETDADGQVFLPLPAIRHRLIGYDFGVKASTLAVLRQAGFQIEVVPAHTSPEEVLAKNPDGIFLSEGPGDPSASKEIQEMIQQLLGKKPVFGVGLGYQLLALALGGRTVKLPHGHHGGNHPVRNTRTKKVTITAQNHHFAVDANALPEAIEITHVNLNDQSIAGIRSRNYAAFGVQYTPQIPAKDSKEENLLDEFAKLIEDFA